MGLQYQAMRTLGKALHALQDLVSHSNFVETGPYELPSSQKQMVLEAIAGGQLIVPPQLKVGYYNEFFPHTHDDVDALSYTHEDHAKDNSGRKDFDAARLVARAISTGVIAEVFGGTGRLCGEPRELSVTPVNSADPNDKLGPTGSGSQQYLTPHR